MRIRDILRPAIVGQNRYYIGKTRHRHLFYIQLAGSMLLILLVGILLRDIRSMVILFIVLLIPNIIFYFLTDKLTDFSFWTLFGRRWYGDEAQSLSPEEHQVIKQFEKDPSEQTREQIKARILKK